MSQWTITLSPQAEEQLADLPPDQQPFIARAIDRMRSNPFAGDVEALKKKKWKGTYRRRFGFWRLFFIPNRKHQRIEIVSIDRRSEKTYR